MKNSIQNAPNLTILSSKVKKIWGGDTDSSPIGKETPRFQTLTPIFPSPSAPRPSRLVPLVLGSLTSCSIFQSLTTSIPTTWL